ncbi:MAG TPA: DUF5666 domain-containing protein [Acidobacteriaceae bacterium]|nr:DUF5666 domain-containing protein [Acidobacteriaceae bacterium]
MKPLRSIAAPLLAAALLLPQLHAAAPQFQGGGMRDFQAHSVRGDITSIAGNNIQVKADNGETWSIATSVNTRFRKQRDFIKISGLHIGDMIAAIGDKNPKAKTLGAVFVMVIDKQRFEQMRADFGKTWTTGVVQSIQGTTITIKRPDKIIQSVAVDENTEFRRRRDDIILPDIKPGDNISARGAIKNGSFLATLVAVMPPGGFRPRGQSGHRGVPGNTPNAAPQPQPNTAPAPQHHQ